MLFLEGKDDCIVISNLCEQRGVNKNFEFKVCESRENAIKELELAINEQATTYSTAGIVIDADTDNYAAWHKVRTKIDATGRYEDIPKILPENGLILNAKKSIYPRLGVWIMPDNQVAGMLEDFVALLANEKNNLMKEAELILQSLEERSLNLYKPIHRAKAKIHTFLAWQDAPGKPMGQAITAKMLRADAKEADLFIEWMVKLFEEE